MLDFNGASDGARTRDLRRDRPARAVNSSTIVSTIFDPQRASKKAKVETAAGTRLPPNQLALVNGLTVASAHCWSISRRGRRQQHAPGVLSRDPIDCTPTGVAKQCENGQSDHCDHQRRSSLWPSIKPIARPTIPPSSSALPCVPGFWRTVSETVCACDLKARVARVARSLASSYTLDTSSVTDSACSDNWRVSRVTWRFRFAISRFIAASVSVVALGVASARGEWLVFSSAILDSFWDGDGERLQERCVPREGGWSCPIRTHGHPS